MNSAARHRGNRLRVALAPLLACCPAACYGPQTVADIEPLDAAAAPVDLPVDNEPDTTNDGGATASPDDSGNPADPAPLPVGPPCLTSCDDLRWLSDVVLPSCEVPPDRECALQLRSWLSAAEWFTRRSMEAMPAAETMPPDPCDLLPQRIYEKDDGSGIIVLCTEACQQLQGAILASEMFIGCP